MERRRIVAQEATNLLAESQKVSGTPGPPVEPVAPTPVAQYLENVNRASAILNREPRKSHQGLRDDSRLSSAKSIIHKFITKLGVSDGKANMGRAKKCNQQLLGLNMRCRDSKLSPGRDCLLLPHDTSPLARSQGRASCCW